jgi:hypothetical protein
MCERIQKEPRTEQVLQSCDAFQADVSAASARRSGALGEATTTEILEYCYPWPGEDRRQRKNQARAVCLAARKMAIVVGRTWPGGNLWRLKD